MESEHKKLSDTITGVHEHLKRSLFFTKDANKVWQNHIEDENLRKTYSSAMLKLATEIWSGKECRIEWTYNTCREYFYNGGLQKSLSREMKLKQISSQTNKEWCLGNLTSNDYENMKCKLKLLDVGSCYNPFAKFEEFSCVAIDLTPGTEDVVQCDFLSIDILPQTNYAVPLSTTLTFHEKSFDIVVFSLVLTYLPATEQRTVFCFKAWQLLKLHGLLIIISPDSKSLHHNIPMVKSWKQALENIGFVRVKYDKLSHLQCMAFRKCRTHSEFDVASCVSLAHLLYTPQDNKIYEEDVCDDVGDREDDDFVCKQFSELPFVS
ncbi:hypothetical protein JTE90_021384 [Oedothorax gibbosus]|uniref:S-adenosylmethionine sensor upstream of mTORC1 n=1 Tax=Oedothorax gibbosus TaxID=931172 RepID=A0AAV6VFY0_9ARAC|nr:hypothetical protein JTE90_021384 [Oedothorax gibbosus]